MVPMVDWIMFSTYLLPIPIPCEIGRRFRHCFTSQIRYAMHVAVSIFLWLLEKRFICQIREKCETIKKHRKSDVRFFVPLFLVCCRGWVVKGILIYRHTKRKPNQFISRTTRKECYLYFCLPRLAVARTASELNSLKFNCANGHATHIPQSFSQSQSANNRIRLN